MNNLKPIYISSNKKGMFYTVPLFLMFAYMAYASYSNEVNLFFMQYSLVRLLLTLLFAALATTIIVGSLGIIFQKKSGLLINKDGFMDYSTNEMYGFITWDRVKNIEYIDEEFYIDIENQIIIHSVGLNITSSKLKNIIFKYWNNHKINQ
ncbi:MAG: hypothetical protein JW871_04320 [Endomicrobiales bacterium]|nr:hypothetical protein [Endomicrobiales bacterium]